MAACSRQEPNNDDNGEPSVPGRVVNMCLLISLQQQHKGGLGVPVLQVRRAGHKEVPKFAQSHADHEQQNSVMNSDLWDSCPRSTIP